MRYKSLEEEIAGKTFQALLVFRQKGGPDSLPLSEIVETFAGTHPGVSYEDLVDPIRQCHLLQVKEGRIYLADNVNEMANMAFGKTPSTGKTETPSEKGCLGIALLMAGTLASLAALLA